jgi:CRISPR-associated protein Cas1
VDALIGIAFIGRIPMHQRLEIFLSPENFQAAWYKVASKKGCAGADGETLAQFSRRLDHNLSKLRQVVMNGAYRPLPLRQFFIPKKDKSWRELRVPAVRDRIVQQALLNVLHPIMEPHFESCSFAYRPGRSHKMAVDKVTAWHRRGYDWVLDADIVKYFDHVGHQRLLQEVAERLPKHTHHDRGADGAADFNTLVLHLVEQWISVGVLTRSGLLLPEKGIPQGSVVSPILANIYLDDFDEAFLDQPLKLVRYADDFVILGRRRQQIIAAREQVADMLAGMALRLHQDKTHATEFDRGFRFLGHVFVGDLVVPIKKIAHQKTTAKPQTSNLRVVHADAQSRPTQLQQAMVEALQQSQRIIPPPLFVVLGYRVRQAQRVEITSKEVIWRPGMSTLYLVQQGATVKKDHGRFLVKAPKEAPLEIPSREVERVLVFGNIQLTTSVISDCLAHQVPVVFLSQLGDYKGHLWSAEYDDIRTEMVQYQRQQEPEFKLVTARAMVAGKLINSKQLLLRLNRKRQRAEVEQAIADLNHDLAAVQAAASLAALRGHEGVGAARYFRALGQLIVNPGFAFTARNRRPPKDPVNSLLSFGYTLLFNNVLSLILAEGLNPYLGNLHGSEKKKTFLAFDLMEEFRSPVVDSLVLRLINQKFLKPTDFTWPNQEGGIYLNEMARRPFLKQFEDRLSTEVSHPDVQSPMSYRRIIQLQIRRYKRTLLEDSPYVAYHKVN